MKRILFKTNKDYFDFINKFKEQINVYEVSFTKKMKIRLFYDII